MAVKENSDLKIDPDPFFQIIPLNFRASNKLIYHKSQLSKLLNLSGMEENKVSLEIEV